jgi:hypothetical protein
MKTIISSILVFCMLISYAQQGNNVRVSGSNAQDGWYDNLRLAFNAINDADQSNKNIIITIENDFTDNNTAHLRGNSGMWSSLSVKSVGHRTISGTVNGSGLIVIFSAKKNTNNNLIYVENVTIDGVQDASNSLTITNSSTSEQAGTSAILVRGTKNVQIKNCHLKGSTTHNVISAGVFYADGTNSQFGGESYGITNNENLLIKGCKIGPAGNNTPSRGIGLNGSGNLYVDISDCEIFDFFNPSQDTYGINVRMGSTANIKGNRLYQTAARVFTSDKTMYGIFIDASGVSESISVRENKIGYASADSQGTLTLSRGGSSGKAKFVGIDMKVVRNANWEYNNDIRDNIISNIKLTSYNTSQNETDFEGIAIRRNTLGRSHMRIWGNTIKNIEVLNSNAVVYLIYVANNQFVQIRNNIVQNINRNAGNHTTYGIVYAGVGGYEATDNMNLFSNKITGIHVVNGKIIGIHASWDEVGFAIYNNLVGNLKSLEAEGENMITGISVKNNEFKKVLLYYNTVFVNNSSSASNFGSSAIFTDIESALDLRNNIFVNTSTPKGSGKTVAFRRAGASMFNYAATSNNNVFYAGTPAPNNLIFLGGNAEDQTIDDFKSRVFPKENVSLSVLPVWFSTNGDDYEYLRLATVNESILKGGKYIEAVKTDYSGAFRDISTPSIGAWEDGKPLNIKNDTEQLVSIFPNPAYETIRVVSPSMITHINLFDMQGRNIIKKYVDTFALDVEVSKLQNGNYILQILTENSVIYRKIQVLK